MRRLGRRDVTRGGCQASIAGDIRAIPLEAEGMIADRTSFLAPLPEHIERTAKVPNDGEIRMHDHRGPSDKPPPEIARSGTLNVAQRLY